MDRMGDNSNEFCREKTSDARYLFRKRASSYVDVIWLCNCLHSCCLHYITLQF